jgi:hypothetical protein
MPQPTLRMVLNQLNLLNWNWFLTNISKMLNNN